MPERPAVREGQILQVGTARVRGLEQDEDAAAVTLAGEQERLERVATEVRVHGQRVGERRTCAAGLEVGARVGPRRSADIAALGVRQHEQTGFTRVIADLLQRAQPGRAVELEEGELRLDANGVGSDCVDDPTAEAREGVGRTFGTVLSFTAQLQRQQIEPRIEPHYELASLALDRFDQPVGEGLRRRLIGGSVLGAVFHSRQG